ncbi:MAG: ATP-binding cassette domain-containing protein [Oceanospirillaceae bacterium]
MLVVNSLSVDTQRRRLLDNVSFTLAKGESLCILGESGSGKTTLLKTLLGLMPISQGYIDLNSTAGHFQRVAKQSNIGLPGVSWVMQNPLAALNPLQPVGISVTEGLYKSKLSKVHQHSCLEQVFAQVQLPMSLSLRTPNQLSIGQAQRVCIARALISLPELIFFDESLSALDAVVQKQIGQMIDDVKRSKGLSYLFVTHDLGFTSAYADKILLLKAGKVEAYQSAGEFFNAPASHYAAALIEAATVLGVLGETQSTIDNFKALTA